MKEEDIALLRRIRSYLPNNSGFGVSNLVYRSPASILRESADKIEAQERDERLFDELIERLLTKSTT